jgi:hypothetical protein
MLIDEVIDRLTHARVPVDLVSEFIDTKPVCRLGLVQELGLPVADLRASDGK